MNELLPFSAYDDPSELPASRLAILAGVPFGLIMFGVSMRGFGFVHSLFVGVLGGLLFGVMWGRRFRPMMVDLSRRLYNSDPALVPPPPAGKYRFRVLGNLFRGRIAVGGHLYAGVERWTFVPHRKNLPRHQAPVEIIPSDAQVVPSPMAGVAKMLATRQAYAVRIDDPTGAIIVKTPEPERVVSALGELRAAQAGSPGTA